MVLFFLLYSADLGLFAAVRKKIRLNALNGNKIDVFERNCPFFCLGHTANEVESAAYQPTVQDGGSVNPQDAAPTPGPASPFFLCMILTAVYNDAYGEYGF